MTKPYVQSGPLINAVQGFFVCFGLVAHLIFFPTFLNYFKTGTWGYPRVGWIVPDRIVEIAGMTIHTNTLITGHVLSTYFLLIFILCQFFMMLFLKRSANLIQAHRVVGSISVGLILPVFCLFAAGVSFYVILTPFNKILFAVLPVVIVYAIFNGLLAIKSGNRESHVDSMYTALIVVNAAPIYRFAAGILTLVGHEGVSTSASQEPNDSGAILRTILVILILVISYYSAGRLRKNIVPIAALLLVLIGAMLLVPWDFSGAPL